MQNEPLFLGDGPQPPAQYDAAVPTVYGADAGQGPECNHPGNDAVREDHAGAVQPGEAAGAADCKHLSVYAWIS